MIDIRKNLKKYFGYDDFKPNQERVVKAIVEGNDTFALLPTGGGKTLCFLLPAMCFNGLTIIISPLTALIRDHFSSCMELNLPANYMNGENYKDHSFVIQKIMERKKSILFITPETLLNKWNELQNFDISCIVYDEAHCVIKWGKTFRQDYFKCAQMLSKTSYKKVCVTATAKVETQDEIVKATGMKEPVFVRGDYVRDNLHIIHENKRDFENSHIINFIKCNQIPGIMFCESRQTCEDWAIILQNNGINARYFHAGLTVNEKNKIVEDLKNGLLDFITATIAFGMGMDIPNIRTTIHHDTPKDIESYAQEIGRAGRDGLFSVCLSLFSYSDFIKFKKRGDSENARTMELFFRTKDKWHFVNTYLTQKG